MGHLQLAENIRYCFAGFRSREEPKILLEHFDHHPDNLRPSTVMPGAVNPDNLRPSTVMPGAVNRSSMTHDTTCRVTMYRQLAHYPRYKRLYDIMASIEVLKTFVHTLF